jgi:hypothetical protein
MENVKKVLEKYGKESIAEMITRLQGQGKVASGKLLRSLKFDVAEAVQGIQISFQASEYAYWVDQGRKPNRRPPPTSVIEDWIKIKGIQGRDKQGRFIKRKSLAYLMARKIGKFGIRPTNFFTITIKRKQKQLASNLSKAFQKDVENQIDVMVKNDFQIKPVKIL